MSSVKIGDGNNFGGDTAIGENARIEKHIHDNSIRYIGNKSDFTSIESLSKYITTNYNEKKVSVWAGILAIIGLLGDFISINSILPKSINLITFIPRFNSTWAWAIFSLCIILLLGGIYVLSAVKYKYDSTCPKCQKHYSMKETAHPQVREVKAQDGLKRTTVRTFRCQSCGHEEKNLYTETIPYEED
jgi:hypothetical protein